MTRMKAIASTPIVKSEFDISVEMLQQVIETNLCVTHELVKPVASWKDEQWANTLGKTRNDF